MKKFMTICAAAIILALSGAATAATNFAMTGTANDSNFGYVQGQSYTFTWTIASSETPTASSGFSTEAGYMYWSEASNTEPVIFSDFTATGMTGTYTRPTVEVDAPSSYAYVTRNGPSQFSISTALMQGIGLSTPDGTTVFAVSLMVSAPVAWAMSDNFIDPAAYFADYAGEYTPTPDVSNVYVWSQNGGVYFTPTSLTIEAAPVPEPATMALLGLGGLLIRRRKA